MTSKDPEREVARALEEMRKSHETSAPSFHAMLKNARARRPQRSAIVPILTVACLLVIVGGSLLLVPRHSPPSRRPDSAMSSSEASLMAWRSPTDSLLDTPGSEIWRGLPRLAEPLPSSPAANSPSPKKGVPS